MELDRLTIILLIQATLLVMQISFVVRLVYLLCKVPFKDGVTFENLGETLRHNAKIQILSSVVIILNLLILIAGDFAPKEDVQRHRELQMPVHQDFHNGDQK